MPRYAGDWYPFALASIILWKLTLSIVYKCKFYPFPFLFPLRESYFFNTVDIPKYLVYIPVPYYYS
jgi:hypothetical protein